MASVRASGRSVCQPYRCTVIQFNDGVAFFLVNILYTAAGRFESALIERNISHWRASHHIVEFMPADALAGYLWLNPKSSLALVDAIVCSADGTPMYTSATGQPEMNYALRARAPTLFGMSTTYQNRVPCETVENGGRYRSLSLGVYSIMRWLRMRSCTPMPI